MSNMKIKRRLAKTLSREDLATLGNLLRDELGEQIANHADFMRKRTEWRNRDKLPKHQDPVFSLTLFERLDEMKRHDAYFRYTKPWEIQSFE